MANKKRGRDDELPEGVQEALDSLSQTLDRESTEQKMRVRLELDERAATGGMPVGCSACCRAFGSAMLEGYAHIRQLQVAAAAACLQPAQVG